ncbi:hypothetical protein C8R46DRAFT_1038291 [Mycena filopes]|nr:hypothetical protein C8R46DRAFT_1038291 [Mycena filopes]
MYASAFWPGYKNSDDAPLATSKQVTLCEEGPAIRQDSEAREQREGLLLTLPYLLATDAFVCQWGRKLPTFVGTQLHSIGRGKESLTKWTPTYSTSGNLLSLFPSKHVADIRRRAEERLIGRGKEFLPSGRLRIVSEFSVSTGTQEVVAGIRCEGRWASQISTLYWLGAGYVEIQSLARSHGILKPASQPILSAYIRRPGSLLCFKSGRRHGPGYTVSHPPTHRGPGPNHEEPEKNPDRGLGLGHVQQRVRQSNLELFKLDLDGGRIGGRAGSTCRLSDRIPTSCFKYLWRNFLRFFKHGVPGEAVAVCYHVSDSQLFNAVHRRHSDSAAATI